MTKEVSAINVKIQTNKISEKTIKNKANKIFALLFTVLMLFSIMLVITNSEVAEVNAQTSNVPSNLLPYEWPQGRATPTGSFYSAGPAPNSPNIEWKASIPGVSQSPVAFNGMVFTSDAAGTVYALDGATGSIVYKILATAGLFGTYVSKIDNTYMLVGTSCFKIADGTKVWDGPPGFSMGFGIPINGAGYIPELKMFVDNAYGWNFADPSKPPTLAWNITDQQNVGTGAAVYGDGKVFIFENNYALKAVDARTGTLLWRVSTTSSGIYGASYYNGMVIHGGLDNNMRAWDANTGKLLWTYNPGTWYGQWASSTAVAYGMVYEHNQDNYIYAINATTGELVWRQLGPGIGYSNELAIADGKVYVQMGEDEYRDFNTGEYAHSEYDCYDAYSGALIWTLPMENGAPFNLQCIAYGNLYVIPNWPTPQEAGVWTYSIGGTMSMGELWCISSTVKDWSMFLADPQHSAEGDGPTNLQSKWTFQTGGPVVSSATCANGVIYFGSSGTDYNIYAVDANTGAQKWKFQTGFEHYSSVAVYGNKVITGADDGNVYAIDANTGQQVWKTFAGGVTRNILGIGFTQVRSSPMVLNGKIYVGALDGNLYCLNSDSGNVIWKFMGESPCVIFASPTISDNAIYLVSTRGGYPLGTGPLVTSGDFYKLDLNGNVVWHKEIPYVLDKTAGQGSFLFAAATVAPDLGLVFMRNGYRLNYAFNITTGEQVWMYDGKYNPGTPFQLGGAPQVDAFLYKYGALYANDFYGVTCRNATTGEEVWYTYLSREINNQGISYAFGRIYVATEAGVLYVLDSMTGAKLSYYEFGNQQMHSSPVPYNGNVYIGAPDWNMYCFGEARTMSAAAAMPQMASLSSIQVQQPSIITSTIPDTTPTATYIAVTAVIVIAAAATIELIHKRRK
jgi:outer membrane protein assembly factor BamB